MKTPSCYSNRPVPARNSYMLIGFASVPAQAIESAVLDSVRRIGTDPKLPEAVAPEALDQVARRRRSVDQESDTQRRSLRQFNQNLAREAADISVDSGARFERIVGLQLERRLQWGRALNLNAAEGTNFRRIVNPYFDGVTFSFVTTIDLPSALTWPVALTVPPAFFSRPAKSWFSI